MDVCSLKRTDGETIAYMKREGRSPGVVWLGGFHSDMAGTKAEALDGWASRTGHAYLRFDYFGHGRSSGEFHDGTISRWREDALAVLDQLCEGPQILVGSSMGGWIALLAAIARPEKVKGLLLLAPAPDFTEALMWDLMPEEVRAEILEKGEWMRPSEYEAPYPITRKLIEDGRTHLLLTGGTLPIHCPVRILQGMKDVDVPWPHVLSLLDHLPGRPEVTLLKEGDHRLSTPPDITRLQEILGGLLAGL